ENIENLGRDKVGLLETDLRFVSRLRVRKVLAPYDVRLKTSETKGMGEETVRQTIPHFGLRRQKMFNLDREPTVKRNKEELRVTRARHPSLLLFRERLTLSSSSLFYLYAWFLENGRSNSLYHDHEAENRAITTITCELPWLRYLLHDL
ncbi:hypothetical protein CR513_40743, partial [Mucuna pruriens]